MRTLVIVCALNLAASASAEAPAASQRVPVVLELFTSEGCSSCPPADLALTRLASAPPPRVSVIPLEFHVDYWNRLGWTDPFSNPLFTKRQEEYSHVFHGDGVFTPQMIVDGAKGFVGDEERARSATKVAGGSPKGVLSMLVSRVGLGVDVSVDIQTLPAGAQQSDLYLAITEDNLTTQVAKGENAGKTLHHSGVVRVLQQVGPAVAGKKLAATIPLDSAWKRPDLKAVAFVQESGKRIIAAAQVAVGP
jgi:hypothetical protein